MRVYQFRHSGKQNVHLCNWDGGVVFLMPVTAHCK